MDVRLIPQPRPATAPEPSRGKGPKPRHRRVEEHEATHRKQEGKGRNPKGRLNRYA